ncbi:hypothetical protein [Azonexus hydrophilus]
MSKKKHDVPEELLAEYPAQAIAQKHLFSSPINQTPSFLTMTMACYHRGCHHGAFLMM